jgi:8-amino-7-oxononanoate synthase
MSGWQNRIKKLKEDNTFRKTRQINSAAAPLIDTSDGKKLLFCSNDYLGLSTHEELIKAVFLSVKNFGAGAGASRLVSGNSSIHDRLENFFAEFAGKEKSVLFSTGYGANTGAISALATEEDVIFSDALCHASIIDGCRLSKAKVVIYRHCDMNHLETALKKETTSKGINLIVTDAVFSMDGDEAPVVDICHLAKKYNAKLYLDEAHAIGVMGPMGKGLAAKYGVAHEVDLLVGTFGKAAGAGGAAIACSANVAQLLKSRARSLLFSTAAPACTAAAALAGLRLILKGDALREKLNANVKYFKTAAAKAGINPVASNTPVQPIITGSARRTVAISERLWEKGVFVQGIRPPTVQEGTSRLRITLSSFHNKDHIDKLIAALVESGI